MADKMTHIREYPYYDLCFSLSGYSGQKDFDNRYLGIDRFLQNKPTVSLKALFHNADDVKAFTEWWELHTVRGEKVFIVDLMFFGEVAKFGITQQSPLIHTVDASGALQYVAFNAKVLFDVNNLHNTPPEAIDKTVFIDKDTRDNFIKLEGVDADFDPIDFEVQVCTAFGTLKGVPPALLYTPDPSFVGTDCFSYITQDYWSNSELAVVTIEVGSQKRPDFLIQYEMSERVRVSGNFHYCFNYQDDPDHDKWVRGFGGYIGYEDPDNDGVYLPATLTIASLDHRVDSRDDLITKMTVLEWGKRTDFKELCKDRLALTELTVDSSAGVCKGVRFDSAFENCGIDSMPAIDFTNAVHMTRAFAKSKIKSVPVLQLPKATHLVEIFKEAETAKIMGVDSPSARYMEEGFAYMPNIECIGYLDTTNAVNKINLFLGTDFNVLHSPDDIARGKLTSDGGFMFSNTAACGVIAGQILKISGTATCQIATVGGTCVSDATYDVAHSGEIVLTGPVKYKWTVSGGTIDGSSTAKSVKVKVTSGAKKKIYVKCDITDDHHTATTGNIGFTHARTYDYAILVLPKSYSQINLDTFIRSKTSKTTVIVHNKGINCSVTTGALSGLDVTFINDRGAELQGFQKGRTNNNDSKHYGLVVTGSMKLVNDGWIRGAGGAGGRGGKGKDSTYKKTHDETKYAFGCGSGYSWAVHTGTNLVTVTWANKWCNRSVGEGKGPVSHDDFSGEFIKSSYKCTAVCQTHAKFYAITRRTYTTHKRTGGSGGYGGYGIGYNTAAQAGGKGSVASPADRHLYSGGAGGKGGGWNDAKGHTGAVGYGNGASGTAGYTRTPAIKGSSHLKSGSKTGHVSGGIA